MIYAVGDIHGELDLLDKLLVEIAKDAAKGSDHTIIFVGDYVDRGPDSKGVIDRVMNGIAGFETICLKGNHEQIFTDFVDEPSPGQAKMWFRDLNGGRETLASYGIDAEDVISSLEEGGCTKRLLNSVPMEHIKWMDALPVCHRTDGYFFVHAGVKPGVPLDKQVPEDMIWIREKFLKSRKNHGAVVVHGHTPSRSAEIKKNRINIDTGACYWGELTAVALGGDEPRLISVM